MENPPEQDETKQQTQLTWQRTQGFLVGGEPSRHWLIQVFQCPRGFKNNPANYGKKVFSHSFLTVSFLRACMQTKPQLGLHIKSYSTSTNEQLNTWTAVQITGLSFSYWTFAVLPAKSRFRIITHALSCLVSTVARFVTVRPRRPATPAAVN